MSYDFTISNLKSQPLDRARYAVTRLNLYEKDLAYCTGCRTCLASGQCVRQDDIQEIAALLRQCQVVALAAPVYWANVPGPVKNLFDRLLGTAMEETAAFPKPRPSGLWTSFSRPPG